MDAPETAAVHEDPAAQSSRPAGRFGLAAHLALTLAPALPERDWCGCLAPLTPRQALADVTAEARELFACRTRAEILDECSDVAFGIGRFLGALTRRTYVPVPGSRAHIVKVTDRFDTHGCVRSSRHLRDGTCPSR